MLRHHARDSLPPCLSRNQCGSRVALIGGIPHGRARSTHGQARLSATSAERYRAIRANLVREGESDNRRDAERCAPVARASYSCCARGSCWRCVLPGPADQPFPSVAAKQRAVAVGSQEVAGSVTPSTGVEAPGGGGSRTIGQPLGDRRLLKRTTPHFTSLFSSGATILLQPRTEIERQVPTLTDWTRGESPTVSLVNFSLTLSAY